MKQLSKALAIALMVACAVAFMPLLNGQAFAAAKKPAKVKISSVTVDGSSAVVKWKKAKNAKTYNVKIDGTVVSKKQKAKSYTAKDLSVGSHKVQVQGVNGKKTGKWSAAKNFTVEAVAKEVKVTGEAAVGKTLTATVYDKAGAPITEGVTYQWYRVMKTEELAIANATAATYVPGVNDFGCALYVVATVSGQTYKSSETALVDDGYVAQIKLVTGHDAPQVGDELTAELIKASDGTDVGGTYQWYAGDAKIASATLKKYTVPAKYVGKTLKVEITASGTKYMSEATKEVIGSTVPTAVKVSGASIVGENHVDWWDETSPTIDTPLVGDVLTAEFYEPEGAVDDGATYQWYRGSDAIVGQTEKSYTVTANDVNKVISVSVKRTFDEGATPISSANLAAAKNSIKAAEVTVKKTAATTAGNRDAFEIKAVKLNGETLTAGTDYAVAGWYLGSSDAKNLLYESAGGAVVKDMKKAETIGKTDYYLCDDPEATTKTFTKVSIVNQNLVVAVEGAGSYAGTAASAATDPVGVATELTAIAGDHAGGAAKIQAGNNTLAPASDGLYPTTADVAYQWYSTKDATVAADSDWDEISGATSKTYVPTTTEAAGGVTGYMLVISSANGYNVIATANSAFLAIDWITSTDPQAVSFIVENTTDETSNARSYAQVGDVLEVTPSLATSASHMSYTWNYTDADGKAQTATGTTFTVPAVSYDGTNNRVTVTPKSDSDLYTATGGVTYGGTDADNFTVNKAIAKVELSSDRTKEVGGVVTFDGVKNPSVGATLTATATAGTDATYEWFADGERVQAPYTKNENVPRSGGIKGNQYQIKAADYGKKLTVKVVGANDYAGSTIVSEETGVVTFIAKAVLTTGNYRHPTVIAEGTALTHGTQYIIRLIDENNNLINGWDLSGHVSYKVVTSNGYELPVDNQWGTFTPSADEVGQSITATVSGVIAIDPDDPAKDLTWTTDVAVK